MTGPLTKDEKGEKILKFSEVFLIETSTTVDRHFQTQSVMTKYKYSEQWKSSKGDERFEYSSGTNPNSNSFCSVEKITDLWRKYCARCKL
jgi:hypothetical protein